MLVLERVRIEPVERPVPSPSASSRPVKLRVAAWMEQVQAAIRRPAFLYAAIILLVVPWLAQWASRGPVAQKMQIARPLSQKAVSRSESIRSERLHALNYLDGGDAADQRRAQEPTSLGRRERVESEGIESEDDVAETLADSPGVGAFVPSAPSVASPAPPAASLSARSSAAPSAPGGATVDLDELAAGAIAPRVDETASRSALSSLQKGISVPKRTIEFRAGLRQEVDPSALADGFMLRVKVATAREPAAEASSGRRVEADGAVPVIEAPAGATLEVRIVDQSTRTDLRHRRRLANAPVIAVPQMYALQDVPSSEPTAPREQSRTQEVDVWVDVEQLGAGPYRIEVRVAGVDEVLAEPMELRLRVPD
jgi:hypothetical protein